jgi:hypothetical protein
VSNIPEEPATEDGTSSKRPTLNAAVVRRRADQAFFLRIRDAMAQNRRALERLGQ